MNKKEDFDIERLKRKRHLNVQEQIFLRMNRMKSSAEYWRNNGLPKCLLKILIDKGIKPEKIMVFEYNEDYDYQNSYNDFDEYETYYEDDITIISEEKKFYYFEVELNKDRTFLVKLKCWKDVTDSFEISEHKKGIGMTDGFLALEILEVLNKKQMPNIS